MKAIESRPRWQGKRIAPRVPICAVPLVGLACLQRDQGRRDVMRALARESAYLIRLFRPAVSRRKRLRALKQFFAL